MFTTGQRTTLEFTFPAPGGPLDYEQLAAPECAADGSVNSVIIVAHDVTERKQQLRQRVEELETVLELAPVAIWISHDPLSHVITGNRTANAFYEAGPGENVSASTTPERRYFQRNANWPPMNYPCSSPR